MTSNSIGKRFRDARDRGCEFLVKQMRSDGGIGELERGVSDYCKVAVALEVCGASAAANRLCNWIRVHGITSSGDFGLRPEEARGYWYTYYNAWIIMGAHRQGHFDISQKGMDFVLGFWDAESGGFYSTPGPSKPTSETLEDICITCGSGMAALYTNRIDVARGVGKWLKKLRELQPSFPQKLYSVYSRAAGLHTEFKPAEATRYVNDYNPTGDGWFFNPGIAAGFLAELYKATGEAEWLNLAQEYMRQPEIANECFLRSLRAGKVCWAASVLYTLTGDDKYRDLASRIGNYLVESQNADGSWNLPNNSLVSIDVTAEMTAWLDEAYQAL